MGTVALLREGTYLLLLSALIYMFWRADIVGVRTHAIPYDYGKSNTKSELLLFLCLRFPQRTGIGSCRFITRLHRDATTRYHSKVARSL